MTKTDAAAMVHSVAVILCLIGAYGADKTAAAESAFNFAIVSAAGLMSSAAVVWKLIHHAPENQP